MSVRLHGIHPGPSMHSVVAVVTEPVVCMKRGIEDAFRILMDKAAIQT